MLTLLAPLPGSAGYGPPRKKNEDGLGLEAAFEATNHYGTEFLRRITPTELLKAELQHQR